MGYLEGLIFALVIIFYIVRGIVQAIRAMAAAARKALGAGTTMTREDARRQAMEQMRREKPSQVAETRRPQPQMRPRRPEAGGPAVTNEADSRQFGAQMARIEAQEGPGMPAAASSEPAPATTGTLFAGKEDPVRAVIWQEILAQPHSQRRRTAQHKEQPPAPPQ